MPPGGRTAHRHQHDFKLQHRTQTSFWPSVATQAIDMLSAAMLVLVACTATWGHVNVHGSCCHWGPWWIPWSCCSLGLCLCLWPMNVTTEVNTDAQSLYIPLNPFWCPWAMYIPRTKMMWVACAAIWGYVDICGPWCYWGPSWSLWSCCSQGPC